MWVFNPIATQQIFFPNPKMKKKSSSRKKSTKKEKPLLQIPTDSPIITVPAPVVPIPAPLAPLPYKLKVPDHYIHTNWQYDTVLEQPPEGVLLHERVVEINGMKWQARNDCQYKTNIYKWVDRVIRANNLTRKEQIAEPLENEFNLWRNLLQDDLFSFVYFAMKNPLANHPFIVNACREIQDTHGDSLQAWARDHLKTTIISVGRSCQKVLNDPERRIGIFSATRPLAVKIQSMIKALFESKFLKACFPDILYEDPYKDAEKWSEAPEGGLIVRRNGFYKEPTISSWGLVEGMPTGFHFTDMVFDDIVTQDLLQPEVTGKVTENFEMAQNLGTRDCQVTVVGTFYRHDDALVNISQLTDPETGKKIFPLNKKPATLDGSVNGKSAFLPESTLAKKRAGRIYIFYCQQLLDPSPRGMEKLNKDHLIVVKRKAIPDNLYKFMLIDGSGDKGKRRDGRDPDPWAMMVVGVEPYRDEIGLSNLYILDLLIRRMDLYVAQQEAVDMYCRNGRILKLAIEKVGMSTTEVHIVSALRKRGRYLSVEQGNLHILHPSGRPKEYRIESALSWPLKNGKIRILDTVPAGDMETLKLEMEKFPVFNDDGLDGLSYVYDLLKEYRFGDREGEVNEEEKNRDKWERAFQKSRERGNRSGWIAV